MLSFRCLIERERERETHGSSIVGSAKLQMLLVNGMLLLLSSLLS